MLILPFLALWAFTVSPGLRLPHSSFRGAQASALSSSQSSDEAAVRTLTEKYGQAIAANDLAVMRSFWNPKSPNLSSRLRVYENAFSRMRMEIIQHRVSRLEVTGDKAVSHLTDDERQLDKLTGAILQSREAFHGACRALEWIRTDAGWRIEKEVVVQEELAARLEAADSDLERDRLLEEGKPYVTDVLVGTLITLGQRHRMRAEYDASMRCAQLEALVAERIGDEAGVAGAWLEMALTKKSQDEVEQALTFMQKALAQYEAAGLHRGSALVLQNMSQAQALLGEYRKAFESARRSLQLYEQASISAGAASAMESLASVYSQQNNFHQSLAYLGRAVDIVEKLGDRIRVAIIRRAMADQFSQLGEYDRALEIYLGILKQTEASGDRGGAAIIENSISDLLAAQGRYAEALEFARRSLSKSEAVSFQQGILSSLFRTGQIYLADGKPEDGLAPAKQATALARQLGLTDFLRVALTVLGGCELGQDHRAEAREAFAEAISIVERMRSETAGGIEENQRFLEGRLQAYHGMFDLLVKEGQPRDALAFAERTKARELLDVLQGGSVSIEKALTPEEKDLERRLKSELNLLNRQVARTTQSAKPDPRRLGELTSQLEKARLEYEACQTLIYSAHPELKIHRGEAPIIKTEELANLVPDAESALLESVVSDERTYLFAVTGAAPGSEADVRLYTLPLKRTELEKETESFRQALAGRDLGLRASAAKLYDLLLKPAQRQLRGRTRLVMLPDDILWDLPFQALISPSRRFVIEDAAIAYAPSLTVLREMRKRRAERHAGTAPLTLLALGNPAAGRQTVGRAGLILRDDPLVPLLEAEAEVKALGLLNGAQRSKIYLGPEAREDRFKSEAGRANILHFATHGMLNDTAPMYSNLVLAPGGGNDDGLLEAWEIMQLDLKADLAILSAGETARGRISAGEGIVGLTWAMFVAGVPATVVSQWKVEAASSRDLLVSFHRALISHSGHGKTAWTPAEDLRQAALKLMRDPATSHPFYWAGFVLVGAGI